jgi:hypothetical protein
VSRRARLTVALVGLAVVVGVLAPVAGLAPGASTRARFTAATAATGSVAADTLAPPTAVMASGGASVALTWTATVDAYASGYQLLRSATSGSGHALVATISPATTTTAGDTPGTGTWYYLLRSVYQAWLSAPSPEVSAVVGAPLTTAPAACTSQAPDTTSAGDNDGYQGNPARACIADDLDATDANTGTGGTQSCGMGAVPDAQKDRHRFWGFDHGVPPTASVIEGITVRADVGMNNNGGNSAICAQLSWDGGTTWTTIQSLATSGLAEATYTFGGAADTWDRVWTAAELSPTSLRVRLINASSQANKRFDLDHVAVSVTYRP